MTESKPVIMIVDDDPMIGRCLTMFLDGQPARPDGHSGGGYRVIFFTNGHKALDYLADNTVNFLLTDLQMPEMTGLELLRQVKTLYPALPALVMSGSADGPLGHPAGGADRDEIFALGADFIAKPFDLADLLKHIRSAQCKRIDSMIKKSSMTIKCYPGFAESQPPAGQRGINSVPPAPTNVGDNFGDEERR